jgi:serine/threonine protein kinase
MVKDNNQENHGNNNNNDIPNTCPPKFAELIQNCINNDPNNRPTAKEVLEYLKENELDIILDVVETVKPKYNLDNIQQYDMIDHKSLKYGKMLGQGASANVFEGIWANLVTVAIKEFFRIMISDPTTQQEFIKEAIFLKELKHPNIVQFYGCCIEPKCCIIIELMSNGSLYDLIHKDKTKELTFNLIIQIAIDIVNGLVYLHDKMQIIHRDMKSMNVLLGYNNKAKITDFGLSKSNNQMSTMFGGAKGTYEYMAPELAVNNPAYTYSCDIYSLSIILWELVTREIPYKDINNKFLIPTHVKAGNRETIPNNCNQAFASIIQQCWDGNPDNRPIASQLLQQLVIIKNEICDSSNNNNNNSDLISSESNNNSININKFESEIYELYCKSRLGNKESFDKLNELSNTNFKLHKDI